MNSFVLARRVLAFATISLIALVTAPSSPLLAQAPTGPTTIDLSTYVRVGRFPLPEPILTPLPPGTPPGNLLAQEASAVTYNWDTDTLFVTGDGGRSITQVTKTGQLVDTMTLAPGGSPQGTDFYDPEGLTYVGNGQFVMSEERDRQAVLFTYAAGTMLTRADTKTVKLGTFVGNEGLEGLSYDPATGGFIFVKEINPQGIFQTNIDFAAGTASNGSPTTVDSTNLFNPALLNALDLADVFALSNLPTISGPEAMNLLVLSQESAKIFNVDRLGNIASTLTIPQEPGSLLTPSGMQHEGLTLDRNGVLYVVNENGGGDIDHPELWVYAPSLLPNQAPTGLSLANQVTSIPENSVISPRRKVADVIIADDGLGVNNLTVFGADASNFEVDATGLYLKQGTNLDYELKTSFTVGVAVDDASVGNSPDATTMFILNVINIVNETPTPPSVAISEVAPWGSGTTPYAVDWFELTNTGATTVNVTGWKMDDSFPPGTAPSPVSLNGISNIGPGESVIFMETSAPESKRAAFLTAWFGANHPPALQVGSYTGGGVGLSTGGDAVNIFDTGGALVASVTFGTSPSGPSFPSFDNSAGLNNANLTQLSVVGVNGAFAATNDAKEIGSPGGITGPPQLVISEVAPWSSGNSPVGADWFEVTNIGASAADITGWKIDDNSESPVGAAPLNGITSIAPGESVIFIETADLTAKRTAFINNWFGGNAPAGLQIGSYTGSGLGLGTGGDAVNLYNRFHVLRASVNFGPSPTATPIPSFDNAAGINFAGISLLSVAGVNGAFIAANAAEVGSPGAVAVSFSSLQAMVIAFSTDTDVTDGLNEKLAAAASANNANARAGQLGAFENQVHAQTGRALTAGQAGILIGLSQALK